MSSNHVVKLTPGAYKELSRLAAKWGFTLAETASRAICDYESLLAEPAKWSRRFVDELLRERAEEFAAAATAKAVAGAGRIAVDMTRDLLRECGLDADLQLDETTGHVTVGEVRPVADVAAPREPKIIDA